MYFNDENQNMMKEAQGNIQGINVQGKVNPRFAGHTHTDDSKRRISKSQTTRYAELKKLANMGLHTPSEERVREICNEVINNHLINMSKKNNNCNIPIL